MLTLYVAGNSICTQKVLITLREKRLEYETRNINLFRNEQYSPEYLKINPKGVVPTLVHDGKVIVESTLICEYLDDVYPEPRLIPADPYLRTQMRLWSKAIDEGIFEATREISFSAVFREKMKNMTEDQRQTRFRNIGDPGRRDRYVSTYEHGAESPYVLQAIAAYEKLFKSLEKSLSQSGPWVLGEVMSLGDINLMPYVARIDYLTLLDLWIADRPLVQEWFRRAKAVPSYQFAIDEPLSEAEVSDMKTYGSMIKNRMRERRTEFLAQIGGTAS